MEVLDAGRQWNAEATASYGRYERRVDSVVPTKENDPSPPIHELAITTPDFTGSYSYLSKQGWEMPIGKMFDDYLASADAKTLSLVEYQMKQMNAKVNIYKALGGGWR